MLVSPERPRTPHRPERPEAGLDPIDAAAQDPAGVPAPGRDHRDHRGALLVGVRGDTDVETTLLQAIDRARCEGRALVVALVRPQAPLSTDAIIQQRAADRVARDLIRRRCLVRSACAEAGVALHDILTIAQPWRLSASGRDRALRRRLHTLARSLHAELHPLPARHDPDNLDDLDDLDDLDGAEPYPVCTRATIAVAVYPGGRAG